MNEISLSNRQHFRLNKINKIKDYFVAEIKERELMSQKLSKYIAFCDYFDNCFINNKRLHFYNIICNSYWNTCRNSKCKC